jgi:tetratricopeptide (TPR) repeat protein
MFSVQRILLVGCVLTLIGAAYSNHFDNSFHFDDSHTIQNNLHVRSLSNISAFFRDARTFSNLPTHQVYRPVLTTSFAIDYVRGGGRPRTFHVTTFACYLIYLATIFALFLYLMNASGVHPSNWIVALCATSVYALHPVSAETINYIVQRGDLLSTMGVVAGIALYAWRPDWRRFGLYLLPVLMGMLCKPPALVFPGILFAFVYLFESRNVKTALRAVAPALVACGIMAIILHSMTAARFDAGGNSPALYRITQTYVALHYFWSFFLPTQLSADSDWRLLTGATDPRAIVGFLFLVGVCIVVWFAQRRTEARPIAFGLIWFVAALFPTSWMPLGEVANDHRMFFPFVGLTLSVVWAAWLSLRPWVGLRTVGAASAIAASLLLTVEARATYVRNEVWRNEGTLWHDVTVKSPQNGRGLMNYALTRMAAGDIATALDYLERARVLNPAYFLLEINLGIAKAQVGRHPEAEGHFLRAPSRYESNYYYGRWLHQCGRTEEALSRLETAKQLNANTLDVKHLLMQIYFEQKRWKALERLAAETLRAVPGDTQALRYGNAEKWFETELQQAAVVAATMPAPDKYLNLSLLYYQAEKYEDCIRAALEALRLNPEYAEAYNNIAAAHNAMQRWSDGIKAADQALRLKPGFELARNNRAWAISQQAAAKR